MNQSLKIISEQSSQHEFLYQKNFVIYIGLFCFKLNDLFKPIFGIFNRFFFIKNHTKINNKLKSYRN